MATGKSDRQGGHRSARRHAKEWTTGGALAMLLVTFMPEDSITAFQGTLMGTVLTGFFSQGGKFVNEGGIGKTLKMLGIGSLVLLTLSGCAISVGQVTPEEFTGHNGETIIACELKGIQFGVFDGGVCRNVEGGQVGETFVDLFTGAVEAMGRILGGVLTGFASAGSALSSSAPAAPPPEPAPAPPAAVPPDFGDFFQED